MTRKMVGKEEFLGMDEITPEEKEFDIKLTPRKSTKKKRDKLDKAELLQLMKEKGKESVDPYHGKLVEYIFEKNDLSATDNRNKSYSQKRVFGAIDLIMAYCDVYPKKDVK